MNGYSLPSTSNSALNSQTPSNENDSPVAMPLESNVEDDEYDPDGLYGSDHDELPPNPSGTNGIGEGKEYDDDDAMSVDEKSDVTVETPPRPPPRELEMLPPGLQLGSV